jgi:Lrp/AsnC family transcriptional regulator, regulator for asnA, asnC and gidA
MSKIDKIDFQIVELLMQEGRMPAAEIARRIGGITERVVRYRIDRMIEEGLISISAIVHPQKIDYSVAADVLLEVETGLIEEVARKLAGFDSISYVACSIGETDVSVQVLAKDTAEIYRLVTEVIGKIPGVRKTTTSIVPVVLKDVYQWHIPEEAAVSGDGGGITIRK